MPDVSEGDTSPQNRGIDAPFVSLVDLGADSGLLTTASTSPAVDTGAPHVQKRCDSPWVVPGLFDLFRGLSDLAKARSTCKVPTTVGSPIERSKVESSQFRLTSESADERSCASGLCSRVAVASTA